MVSLAGSSSVACLAERHKCWMSRCRVDGRTLTGSHWVSLDLTGPGWVSLVTWDKDAQLIPFRTTAVQFANVLPLPSLYINSFFGRSEPQNLLPELPEVVPGVRGGGGVRGVSASHNLSRRFDADWMGKKKKKVGKTGKSGRGGGALTMMSRCAGHLWGLPDHSDTHTHTHAHK